MDGAVIIAWTPTNWATIFLMALGGFLLVKLAIMGAKKVTTGSAT